ncbi:hypothetical protein [Nocardioides sediminis]|uniref:hypothetical protein n=1 Tax=Nocardioides sediminis TaxID=433648 RepID=UPI00131F34FB|nr:hypothetical protein [Nocardioides sediminis]
MTSADQPGSDQQPMAVMVELLSRPGPSKTVDDLAADLVGFAPDHEFEPVPMATGPTGEGPTVIIRGSIDTPDRMAQLAAQPGVVRVWLDTPTAPIDPSGLAI